MAIDGAAPITTAHAVIPHGQMEGDEHAVVPAGQAHEGEIQPPSMDKLRKMFDEARDLTNTAREEQQRDQDYYDGPEQLNSETRAILKARMQPPIYDNRIAPAVDGILGIIEQAKSDPRAFPRNPGDDNAADVATKTLRYINDSTRFHETKMDCAEDFHKQGLCAVIIESDGENITPTQIRWEEFFYDPTSRRNDFKDAKYLGIAKWMYADELRALYPERYAELGDPISGTLSALESTWDDRPDNYKPWVDRRRQRLMVVEIYFREGGQWFRCVYCAAGWLEFDESPYIDPRTQAGICPIEAQSYKVDRHNNRYGPIRNMRPMQDEVNARRSRGLHLLNARQLQQTSEDAPPIDADTARQEAARADGILPPGYGLVPTVDMASGNLQLLAEAKDSLARLAPTPAVLGRQESASQSGRARQVIQQAGLTEIARPLGRFTDFEQRCYVQMFMRAQQFWEGPKWIRVTDNPQAPEFLQVNEPVIGPVLEPVVDPATGQPAIDPMTGQPAMQEGIGIVEVRNRLAEMDMDIIVDLVPDTTTLEQEVFASVTDLVRGGLDPFSPQFEIMVELSPIPDKARLLDRIKAFREEQQQAQAEQMQQQQAMAQQAAQIEAEHMQSETAENIANAQKRQAEAFHEAIEAQRLQVTPLGLNN